MIEYQSFFFLLYENLCIEVYIVVFIIEELGDLRFFQYNLLFFFSQVKVNIYFFMI